MLVEAAGKEGKKANFAGVRVIMDGKEIHSAMSTVEVSMEDDILQLHHLEWHLTSDLCYTVQKLLHC